MRKLVGTVLLVLASTVMTGCVTENLIMEGKDKYRVSSGVDHKKAALGRVQIALRLLEDGNATLAKDNLEVAFKFDPDCFDAKLAYAWYYQRVGETANAYRAYDDLVSDYSDKGDVFNNYGIFLCSEGKYPEAYQMYERAVVIPKYTRIAETLVNAGRCAYKQGDDNRAIKYVDRALQYNGNDAFTLAFRAELALGVGDLKKAREMMMRYSRYAPDDAYSLFTKLRIEEGSGHKDRAQYFGQKLLQEYPNSPEAQKYTTNNY